MVMNETGSPSISRSGCRWSRRRRARRTGWRRTGRQPARRRGARKRSLARCAVLAPACGPSPNPRPLPSGIFLAPSIPHTGLTIVRLEDGPKAGQYVFSAATVEEARRLYDKVRLYGGRVQAGTDLYRFCTLTPGDLLPPKWYFLIERLPEWAQVRFFLDHALWQWVGIVLTLVVLFGGWSLIVRAIGRHRPADERPGRFGASCRRSSLAVLADTLQMASRISSIA